MEKLPLYVNYALVAITGIYTLFGTLTLVNGGSKMKPFTVAAAAVLFVLMFIVTRIGWTYENLAFLFVE